jgi:hypothetical protein
VWKDQILLDIDEIVRWNASQRRKRPFRFVEKIVDAVTLFDLRQTIVKSVSLGQDVEVN